MLKFGTDGLRGKVGEWPLVVGEMVHVGYAIGRYFKSVGGGNVAIGCDTRESGYWITGELSRGLMRAGCAVYDAGVVTTPMLARAVKTSPILNGGLVVTASHNTYRYNGVKVLDKNGEKLMPGEERAIEVLYESPDHREPSDEEPASGHLINFDALTPYLAGLTKTCFGAEKLRGYCVSVDSAAGAAFGVAKRVFDYFGVRCREVGAVPTGRNINQGGALHPVALANFPPHFFATDLGIALDGDADRVVLVEPNEGQVWNGDRIVAMLATWLPRLGWKIKDVVLTQYSNGGVVEYLRRNGLSVETVLVGDREVYAKCRETGAELGGETAGHIIAPSWLSSSDGIFVALLVLWVMDKTGRKLSELRPRYAELPSLQWSVTDPSEVPLENIPGFAEILRTAEATLKKGRIFVRRSGTETDKIRILVEAPSEMLCHNIGDRLVAWLEQALAQK